MREKREEREVREVRKVRERREVCDECLVYECTGVCMLNAGMNAVASYKVGDPRWLGAQVQR